MGIPYVGPPPANAGDLIPKSYADTIETGIKSTTLGGLTFVKLTQAAYTALGTKDANTVYLIVG